MTGYFQSTLDFGGGPLTSAGSLDTFLAKFNPSGAHLWSKRFGSTGSDSSTNVAVDGSGNVVMAGSFSGTVDFGSGPLTSARLYDTFLAKLRPDRTSTPSHGGR